MNFLRLLIVVFLGWLGWRTVRSVQRTSNEKERALAIRGSIVLWILGLLSVAALFAVPGRGRLLVIIPLTLVMVSAAKAFFKSRRQLRQAADFETKLERMKRVG